MSQRVALVTGAASGIGLAVASALVSAGWQVAMADQQPSVLDAAENIGGTGRIVDVRDVQNVENWVNEFPSADVLVTAAGICFGTPLTDSVDDDWERLLDVNLMGTVRPLRAFARNRIAVGGGGCAILIASNNSFWPHRGLIQYCVSKAGVAMLGKTAASELGQHGIRVNVVAPGETRTAMTEEALQMPGVLDSIVERTPLGRIGQPSDIGSAVQLLVSDAAAWITGQLISVDGGISLRGEPG